MLEAEDECTIVRMTRTVFGKQVYEDFHTAVPNTISIKNTNKNGFEQHTK
jgi:hypothetical protein